MYIDLIISSPFSFAHSSFQIPLKENSIMTSYYYPPSPPVSLCRDGSRSSTIQAWNHSESKTVASRYPLDKKPKILGGNNTPACKRVSSESIRIVVESHKSVKSSPSSMFDSLLLFVDC